MTRLTACQRLCSYNKCYNHCGQFAPLHRSHLCAKHRPITGSRATTVDHPKHYGGKDNPYETIKVIEAWGLDFCLGNAVKYISRAGKKGSLVEDLKKAKWYIERAIQQAGK